MLSNKLILLSIIIDNKTVKISNLARNVACNKKLKSFFFKKEEKKIDILYYHRNYHTKNNDTILPILYKLKNQFSVWNDLNLGTISSQYKTFLSVGEYYKLDFYPIIDRLTNEKEKYFYIKVHDYKELVNILQVFKNAKVIDFENDDLFSDIRNCNNNNSLFSLMYYSILYNPELCPKLYEKWKSTEQTYYPEVMKQYLIDIAKNELLKLLKNKDIMTELKRLLNMQML
jgi:hypothetical protein